MNKLLLTNINELVTCRGSAPKCGAEMNDAGIINDGFIAIEDGKIVEVGKNKDLLIKYADKEYKKIDCSKNAVLPGFIDSHTHFVFGGYRQDEFSQRLSGTSYMDILKMGGGIAQTVKNTRSASLSELIESGMKRADVMVSLGITTVEGKSGYGLDKDTELKQLKAMKKINELHAITVVSTFLGAHAVPEEYIGRNEEYLDFVIREVLPVIKDENLAEYVDIFCEEGVFNIDQSRKYLTAAKNMGFKIKLHADEIINSGGAILGAELNATSADHLLQTSKEGAKAMSDKNVIAVLLPATAFCLREKYADARYLIDNGCAVALATDFNPGSSFTSSIPLVIALAALWMNMNIREIVTALTINGACSIGMQNEIGSIEKGKWADVIILDYPTIDFLPYNTGMNIVKTVIKRGKVVINRREL